MGDTSSKAILVVDDEERIGDLLVDTLKSKGFTVYAARNGDQALKLFEKHKPDLVITDIMLPRMDGYTLVRKLREHPHGQNLPIIMMSAVYRDPKTKETAVKTHGVEFLVKPFSLVDLVKILQKIWGEEVDLPQLSAAHRDEVPKK